MSDLQSNNQNLNLKSNVKYRAYKFSLDIVGLVKDFPQNKLYSIFLDQLVRSATSIGANLIEAKASSSRRDFIKFYQIALKSANESIYWLCLLKDSKMKEEHMINPLTKEAKEIANMVGASLLTLKKKN